MIDAIAGWTGRKREKQTRYLSQALQLEEAVNPRIILATMTMVSLSVVVFLAWAGFTNINEVARTPGDVVPSGYQQTVQHLEGGVVGAIHVHEGDVVREGQSLVTLDDSGIREDMERAESRQLFLDMQAERLRAFLDGREPDFSQFPDASADAVSDQLSLFRSMQEAGDKEDQVVREQIAQKEQALNALKAGLETARKNYRIANDIYHRRAALNKEGYASDMRLLEDERQVNEIGGAIRQMESQILVSRSEIDEFKSRLESLDANQVDEARQTLEQTVAEKEQNIKTVAKLGERVRRLDIRSPAHGLVKGLAVNTIGAVVLPGQTIMEIVPLDKPLEAQVKISPKDVGHLAVGQEVQVKFSTYDFSRYGSVAGRLERISATTFAGENGERYYQGQIRLDKNYVGDDPANMVLPGMTVMADVITGERTILDYLLKPVQVSAQTAFSER